MEIFDAYVEDLIRQDKAKEKKGKSSMAQEDERKRPLQSDLQSDDITRVSHAAKVMERMVNQNTFDDIAQGMTTSQYNQYTHTMLRTIECRFQVL